MRMTDAASLTNDQLVAVLPGLAGAEREATVALIIHLAEFDGRRLYEGLGFRTLWDYCLEVLRLSEDAAANRIQAARMARRYPRVVDMLLSGDLSPTTARLVAAKVTDENHDHLLAAAAGKSRRQVEEVLAGWFPPPDVPAAVRKLPAKHPPAVASSSLPMSGAASLTDDGHVSGPSSVGTTGPPSTPTAVPSSTPTARPPVVRPLAPERYEVRYTATTEMRDTLQFAQDLLTHAIPSGDIGQVIHRALTGMVKELVRKKFAVSRRPGRSRRQAEGSRNVPAEVKRHVYLRDRGFCAYVSADGRRCGSRRFLQFHHVEPHAQGGKPTLDNVSLRCRSHNLHEAEVFYGFGNRYRTGSLRAVTARSEITRPGTGEASPPAGGEPMSQTPGPAAMSP